jgi:hypothetical protein
MQVLTPDEAKVFLSANGFGEKLTRLAPGTFRREVTNDVGRRCAYANMLTNHLVTSESAIACLDITDWGGKTWGEDLGTFTTFSYGLRAPSVSIQLGSKSHSIGFALLLHLNRLGRGPDSNRRD